ncbi:MAG: hypothetical protein P4L50_00670, partial [Anaerolineaceae bacterium]|nr:hypothetical protein [Anaerolineaceae bacterium]
RQAHARASPKNMVSASIALQKSNRYRQTRSSKDPRESPDSTQPRYALSTECLRKVCFATNSGQKDGVIGRFTLLGLRLLAVSVAMITRAPVSRKIVLPSLRQHRSLPSGNVI